MTDSAKMDLILSEIQVMKSDMLDMKSDMQTMKTDMLDMKSDIVNVKDRLEVLEIKQGLTHKKLDNLTLDVKISERSIRKDIKLLQDAQETLITVLENQGILPSVK